MKRLAWLFLAVFCTALAQVPRVELPVAPQETCGCCEEPGACGMPECAPPPVAIPSVYSTERPVTVARPTASQAATVVAVVAPKFWSAFVPEPAVTPLVLGVAADSSPPSQVPLFKAHCAFLI